jgi:hypothetical protein
MATLNGQAPIPSPSLTAATLTYIAICTAPSNQRVKIAGFHVGFNGTTNSNTPVLVEWGFAASAGSGGTAITPLAIEQDAAETFQSTWTSFTSSNPSTPAIRNFRFVHPQLSTEIYLPMGREFIIKGGGFFFIAVNAPQSVNVAGFVDFEE